MEGFIFLCISFIAGMGLLTWLLHYIRIRWVKYVPGGLFIIIGLVCLILAQGYIPEGGGFGDIVLKLAGILLTVSGLFGGLFAVILDKRNRKFK